MLLNIHLKQLWFIGWNCFFVHTFTNITELISAINVEYNMDHNVYILENVENENVIEFNYNNASNTIYTSAYLSNNSLQQVFGNRVLLMLIFHQFDYNATKNTLSKINNLLNSDMKIIVYYGR